MRYAVGIGLAMLGLAVTALVTSATDEPVFTVLIGMVAVAAWYGGLGPGVAAIVTGWFGGWWILLEPPTVLGAPPDEAVARWAVGLAAACVIVAVAAAMRRGRERAVTEAGEAEAAQLMTAGIQRLASELSAAVTQSDVARALVEHTPPLVGARGGALGMIDGSDLVIVDPLGTVEQTITPGLRLPLTARAPIAKAARDGEPVISVDRASFRRDYPDGADLAPYAHGALAVPISIAGRVVGAMGFPFGLPGTVSESTLSIARIAADLGGQALERAELYEDERSMRRALDAILRTAPRFAASSLEEGVASVCEEARATFGADIAQVWRIGDGTQWEVLWRKPEHGDIPPGTVVSLADYPGLPEALEQLRLSFVPDVQAVLEGSALEHVRRHGVRSSLRVPIVIEGEVSKLLILQWQGVIAEPGPSQILLARRFADQAGLVLEQLERRAAERAAARAAEDTKRLLDVTSALTSVASLPDVAAAILEEGCRSLGARAGVVVLKHRADDVLERVETTAEGVDTPDPATLALLTEALRSGEQLAAASVSELHARVDLDADDAVYQSWLAIPFTVARKVVGGLGLAFDTPQQLSLADLDFAKALGRQAGVSVERALQYESERTIAETLQQSVLPESLPFVDGVQMAARYLPGTAAVDVGGDWFDAISLPDGRLGLAVGDVVGKGVRAAATMAQLRNGLRAFALDQMRPSATVARLNRLTGEVDESAFATLVYAVVDPGRRVVRFTSAGHPPPLVIYPDRRTEFAEGGRSLPLGVSASAAFEQDVIELPTGSTLVLFTDGLVERRGSTLAEGFERLRAAAAEAPGDPERLVDHVLDQLVGDAVRGDDIAVLAVRLLAAAPAPLDLRLPATPRSLDVVRDALRLWLANAPVSDEEAHEVVLAAWEACANAVEHPQDARKHAFTLSARADDGRILIDVTDSGSWRNGRGHPDRGLGLHLIRSVMTTVSVLRGEDGTRVHMEKALVEP